MRSAVTLRRQSPLGSAPGGVLQPVDAQRARQRRGRRNVDLEDRALGEVDVGVFGAPVEQRDSDIPPTDGYVLHDYAVSQEHGLLGYRHAVSVEDGHEIVEHSAAAGSEHNVRCQIVAPVGIEVAFPPAFLKRVLVPGRPAGGLADSKASLEPDKLAVDAESKAPKLLTSQGPV